MPNQRLPSAKPEVARTGDTAVSPHNMAMNMLARREHSLLELKTKLIARDIPPDEADDVVASLAARNLVSDERFAGSFVRVRVRKGQGPVRIRQELRQRGVSSDVIHAHLDTMASEWNSLADEVRRKKFGGVAPPDYKAKARQMRFLEYRGFTTEQIMTALENVSSDDD